MKRLARRVGLVIALLVWASLAFWTFSLGFSASFFRDHLPARLPPFVAAFAGAVAIPISAFCQWRRARLGTTSRLRAWLAHVVAAAACLAPLVATSAVLARAPSPWHLSGDDAMGVGIDFLHLIAAAVASAVALALALALRRPAVPSQIDAAKEVG